MNAYSSLYGTIPRKLAPIDVMATIDKYIPRDAKILEVGCSSGYNLDFLESIGYTNLSGVDIDKGATTSGKLEYKNLNLFCGNIFEQEVEFSSKFDLIFSISTLQHIPYNLFSKVIDTIHHISEPSSSLIFFESSGPIGEIVRKDADPSNTGQAPGATLYNHDYTSFARAGFQIKHSAPYLWYGRRE